MELSKLDEIQLGKALELQKIDKDHEALSILKDLLERNPKNYKVNGILGLILGGKLEKREEAIPYLKYAVSNSSYEHFHLSLYISYAEIEDYDKAFNVLFSYLKEHPAKLFKETLQELLEGLLNGYGNTYKKEILFYSKKNNVAIPNGL